MKKYLVDLAIVLVSAAILLVSFNFKKDINEEELISNALSICHSWDRTKDILCFKKNFKKNVLKYGIGPFVKAINGMFLGENPVLTSPTRCHDILHAVGQLGGASSKNINQTISQCSETCTYGCFHGVIEGYLMKGSDIVKEIPKLCRIEDDDNVKFRAPCYHGLGHGLASIAGFDLMKATTLCDLIPEEKYRTDCGSGIIMELYEQGSFSHAILEWPADISEFCSSLSYPYSKVCHVTAGLHEYGRSRDPQKAFKTCTSVPSDLKLECDLSIGRGFYYVFQGSASKIIKACDNNDREVFLNCIRGAIQVMYSVSQGTKGLELCNKLEDKYQEKCTEFLEDQEN